ELVRTEGVTTIFTEELVSPEVAQALARETGVATAVLNPLEGLTQTQLEAGEDYGSVMRQNLEALRGALGCA
ncbi:MAG TPA: zinc ABC transporter substrate-binding protein, partial [Actinomycetota bacterium]|nr:zinc ABC transporter substrate-binding protein [Actinomycetota bacterium]